MTCGDIEFHKSTGHPVNWQGWSLECTLHSPAAGRPLLQHPKKHFKWTRVLKPPCTQHTWQPRTTRYLYLSFALLRQCSERRKVSFSMQASILSPTELLRACQGHCFLISLGSTWWLSKSQHPNFCTEGITLVPRMCIGDKGPQFHSPAMWTGTSSLTY
jgi:hypothetical protein